MEECNIERVWESVESECVIFGFHQIYNFMNFLFITFAAICGCQVAILCLLSLAGTFNNWSEGAFSDHCIFRYTLMSALENTSLPRSAQLN